MGKIISEAEYLRGCMESYETGKRDGQKSITRVILNILVTALTDDKKVQLITDFVKAWEE